MLTSSELKKIPIFSCLNDANLMWLSQQAAVLHLEPGERGLRPLQGRVAALP